MKLLPIALVLVGTTGLAGLAFAAAQTVTVRELAMPGATVARDDQSPLRLADFSYDDDDDEDEGEDDDDEGSDDDDDDDDEDDSAAPFAPVICLTGTTEGDDDDDGTPVCDPAGQTVTGPAAVTPDPNRSPIFNSAPTAVVN
jgi:hypothetical protein